MDAGPHTRSDVCGGQDARYSREWRERLGGDGLLQFRFRLSGEPKIEVADTKPLHTARPALYVWASGAGNELHPADSTAVNHRLVVIGVRAQFLADEILTPLAELPLALRPGAAGSMPYLRLPLSPRVFDLAGRLIDHSHSGPLGLVHLEALAIELLCEAFACVSGSRARPEAPQSPREAKCLQTARDMLMRQHTPRRRSARWRAR